MSTTNTSGGSVPVPIPITLDYVFGLKGDVKNNIHYLDDTTVLYPAGYNIVIYNTEKKTQKFIALGSSERISSCDISALAFLNSSTFPSYSHASGTYTSNSLSTTTKTTRLLAVAERGENNTANVTVIDFQSLRKKTRYVLSSPDVNSTEYVSLAFSADGKYLLTQGGGPDWTLVNWNWEKGRVLHTVRVSNTAGGQITQVSFCPVDTNVICVTGNGILRFLHCEENEMRAINVSMEGCTGTQHYTCHCWIEERVLVATDTGDILLFENAEFIGALASSPGDGKSIEVLCPYSKGFIAGCDEGVIYVYVCDDKQYYTVHKSLQIENNLVKIKNIAVSPSEEHIVITLENDQSFILSINLSTNSIQNQTSSGGSSNTAATTLMNVDELAISPLTPPCHFQAILGMSTCSRKPLLATCGLDRSVRIWNYITKNLLLLQFFSEQPLCIGMHPTGLQVLVGFADGVRLFSILIDTLKCIYQFPIKACREIQVSHGGQYFAIANGSIVQIFAFYTLEIIGTFTLHRGRIRSLCWSHDDSMLTTASVDGHTYSFKVTTTQTDKQTDFPLLASYKVSKGHVLSAITDPDNKGSIYVSSSDMRVRVLRDSECIAQQQHTLTINSLALASNLVVTVNNNTNNTNTNNSNANNSNALTNFKSSTNTNANTSFGKTNTITASVLFGGSDLGLLRCFMLPLSSVCFDIHCHSAPITRVLVSSCGEYVFTIGEDGLLCIFRLSDGVTNPSIANTNSTGIFLPNLTSPSNTTNGTSAGNTNSPTNINATTSLTTNTGNGSLLPWSEEILVGYDDLAEQENKIIELHERVERMILDNEALLQQKKQYYIEKRQEMERKFDSELQDTFLKLRELEEHKRKSESWFAYRIEQLSQHQSEKLKAQEILYADKVKAEQQRCEELAAEIENERKAMLKEEEEFIAQCEAEKAKMLEEYNMKIALEQEKKQELVAQAQKKAAEYAVLKQAIEDDIDEEIDGIKANFDQKFIKERSTTLKLRDSNTVQQQKFNDLRNAVQKEVNELKVLKAKQEQLYNDVNELNQEIHINIRELHERDATMKEKVERLTELKKQSHELEKFTFVLDSKYQELQRQLVPRREEMQNLRTQVAQMQKELQQYHNIGNELRLNVTRRNNKLAGIKTELEQVNAQKKLLKNRVHAFRSCIKDVLGGAVHAIYRIQQEMSTKSTGIVDGSKDANNASGKGKNSVGKNKKDGSNTSTNIPTNVSAQDIETALNAIALSAVHHQELCTVTKQIKHGLKYIYQHHVLNVNEKELLEKQKSLLVYQRIHKHDEKEQEKLSLEHKDNTGSITHANTLGNTTGTTNISSITSKDGTKLKTKIAFGTTVGSGTGLHTANAVVGEERSDYERERGYLERSIDSLVVKSTKEEKMHARERQRIMRENVILIEEINELRRELQLSRLLHKKKHASTNPSQETSARQQLDQTLASQAEQIRTLKNYIMVLDAQEAEFDK